MGLGFCLGPVTPPGPTVAPRKGFPVSSQTGTVPKVGTEVRLPVCPIPWNVMAGSGPGVVG